jgi:uncharacterized protein (DUF885 family)
MKTLIIFLLLAISNHSVAAEKPNGNYDQQAGDLMKEYWDATQKIKTGSTETANLLLFFPDHSSTGQQKLISINLQAQKKVAELLLKNIASQTRIHLETLLWIAENENTRINSPISYLIFNDVYSWVDLYLTSTIAKYASDEDNYLAMLGQLPTFIDQQSKILEGAVLHGFTQPKLNTKAHIARIERLNNGELLQLLMGPYSNDAPPSLKTKSAIESALASMKDYTRYLSNEYLLASRGDIGLSFTPTGNTAYNNEIAYCSSSKITPKALHDAGLIEVGNIHTQAQELLSTMPQSSRYGTFGLSSVFKSMRDDPSLGFDSKKGHHRLCNRTQLLIAKTDS